MTDKKSKPSVAQSLEVIFEVTNENTDSIKELASIQMDAMHMLANTIKKIEECLGQDVFITYMDGMRREHSSNNAVLNQAISGWESKREAMETKIKEQRSLKVNYIRYFVVAMVFFISTAYMSWKEQKNSALGEKRLQVYERFVKEDGLDKRFRKWLEN